MPSDSPTDLDFHQLAWAYLDAQLRWRYQQPDSTPETVAQAHDALVGAWIDDRTQQALLLGHYCLTLDAGRVTTRRSIFAINPTDLGLIERALDWVEAQIPFPSFDDLLPRKDDPNA